MPDRPSSIVLPRDSHDLSLSPRNVTRDSFVTNMLLSLDQFSINQTTSHNESDSYDPPQSIQYPSSWANIVSETTSRGHAHQYSYGSERDSTEGSGRVSEQTSRGRRSDSNPISAAGISRLDSIHEKERNHTATASPTDVESPHAAHRDSPSSSRGIGQSTGYRSSIQPLQPAPPIVSQQNQTASPTNVWHQQNDPMSPFQIDFGDGFATEDFDAAPTPTIYSGPRRKPSAPAMIQQTSAEPSAGRSLDPRKRSSSSRSLKASAGRKGGASRDQVPTVPSVPNIDADIDSAPAPSVGYGKPKEFKSGSSPAGSAAPPAKERHGFFRKIFGGSSKAQNDTLDPPLNYRLATSSDGPDRASSSRGGSQSNLTKSGSILSARDTASSHSQSSPALTKRPSSFFRRRRKSVNDEAAPATEAPPVPLINPVFQQEAAVTSSPVASSSGMRTPQRLKKPRETPSTPTKQANTPARTSANTTPETSGGRDEAAEYQREFSPDYEPSPNARIRTVQPALEQALTPPRHKASAIFQKRLDNSHTRADTFLDLEVGSEDEHAEKGSGSIMLGTKKTHGDVVGKNATIRAKKRTYPRLDIEDQREQSGLDASTVNSLPAITTDVKKDTNSQAINALRSVKSKSLDEPEFVVGEPTEDDRSKAQKIYDGNEDFIQQHKAASWMGEEGTVRQRTLQAYMELYSFSGCSIVHSLRQVCGRLVLRAETQQVDRILEAFSRRWVECNPNHGFKATDVIHTICYSIILLNTDLHLADIEQKMTRSQFVKNTSSTIVQALRDVAPEALTPRPSILSESQTPGPTQEPDKRSFRSSFKPPARSESGMSDGTPDCGPLVKSPFFGSMKLWEELIENVLKNIYSSIRDERLPLFGAEPERHLSTAPSQSSLSVGGILRRSPSVLSRTPSETHLSSRGRINEASRPPASRWSSKSRSRPGMSRTGFSSSNTSFDDGGSPWSPALSSMNWSRQSLGRTQTSVSQDSFGSAMPRGDYQQSIGFANALSQAIIRDEDANGNETTPSILSADVPAVQLLDDESLELSGPPWVKEGMVVHKHHLDGVDKKARERNWSEVFAVIQKGQMSLFSFNASKSQRQKSRSRDPYRTNAPVGGGNWQDNATTVGNFSLRQTLASALPPPGYSRSRPFVWALSLPTGAVHLFQVGTTDLIKEFVNTVNYWSARLSSHPLVGGISNIEYGWSDAIVNSALVAAMNEIPTVKTHRPSSSLGRRSSVTSGSFRGSSLDQGLGSLTTSSSRGKLPGDRIHIADWAPPTQNMRHSSATEAKQLDALTAYVKGVEGELQVHNQLRSPMLLAFTPRGSNAARAMSNWERKSAYLLREIVKFRTYVDCLQAAELRKKDVYTERDLARRAARGELSDGDMELTDEEADETLRP